jgi:very-short-patch-repair endonuclease
MKDLSRIKKNKKGYYMEYIRKSGKQKTPLRRCYGKILICSVCGKPYFALNRSLKKGIGKFCSHNCRGKIYKPRLGYISSKEHRRKISKAHKGKHFSEETKRKMREAHVRYMASGKIKKRQTNIENKIEIELKRRNIYYEKQIPLCKVTIVDFYLPQTRTVIYCDGDYWHSKPSYKKRDINQDLILMFHGFNVFRFPETEIKKSATRCINKILKQIPILPTSTTPPIIATGQIVAM